MSQFNEQEKALVEILGKECRTPAELSSKLKELFAVRWKRFWKRSWMNTWVTKNTASRETTAGIAGMGMGAKQCKQNGARPKS